MGDVYCVCWDSPVMYDTLLGQWDFFCFVYKLVWVVINRYRYRITLAGING